MTLNLLSGEVARFGLCGRANESRQWRVEMARKIELVCQLDDRIPGLAMTSRLHLR